MGSTLARPGTLSEPFYAPSTSSEALKRLEQTSFVGCPAYLLEAIISVHAQWHSQSADSPSAAVDVDSPQFSTRASTPSFHSEEADQPVIRTPSALLEHIRAFDPAAWAESMQTFHFLPDLSARIALAAAYKSAVYLYVARMLCHQRCSQNHHSRSSSSSSSTLSSPSSFSPATSTHHIHTDTTVPPDHRAISYELIRQLSAVPPTDPHFKCFFWPTFIAGAESRRRSQRSTILALLSSIYYAITSANVRNAAWVLSVMWQKKDLQRQQRYRARQSRQQQQKRQQQQHGFSSSTFDTPSSSSSLFDDHHYGHNNYGSHVDVDGYAGSAENNAYDDADDDDDDDDDEFDWIQELDNSQIDWLFI